MYFVRNSQSCSPYAYNYGALLATNAWACHLPCPSIGSNLKLAGYYVSGSPSNVVANVVGPGSLNISWSYVAIEGEVTNFTVTVINQSNTRLMEVSGIQDQHYIFSIENNASCDVYSFQVTAMNGAGRSTPSQIIRRRVPSLPDISPVQDSLQHSLVRTASGVALSVTFNVRTLLTS